MADLDVQQVPRETDKGKADLYRDIPLSYSASSFPLEYCLPWFCGPKNQRATKLREWSSPAGRLAIIGGLRQEHLTCHMHIQFQCLAIVQEVMAKFDA